MGEGEASGRFLLLSSGPVENDQIRGDVDLITVHGLTRVAEVILSGNSKIENYAGSLKHYTGLRK